MAFLFQATTPVYKFFSSCARDSILIHYLRSLRLRSIFCRRPTARIGARLLAHLSACWGPSMLNFLRGTVLIAAFVLNSDFAYAEADLNSANYIMRGCRALLEPDPPKDMNTKFLSTQCRAIIRGLIYASSSRICPPQSEKANADVRVVVKFIDDQPTRLHERFFALALEALQAAWPCK